MPFWYDQDGFPPPIFGEDRNPIEYDNKLAEYRPELEEGGDWRSHLSNDWLSPRMRELILTTAHINADDPYLLEECPYWIPSEVRAKARCSQENFNHGWYHVVQKIGDTF